MACEWSVARALRTHSPTTRRPSASLTSTGSTRVPASEGPKVSMTRATICREAHKPQACSGGSTALIWRRVAWLTPAAPRERRDPRAGRVGSGMRTSVIGMSEEYTPNGDICQCHHWSLRLSRRVAAPAEAVDVLTHVQRQLQVGGRRLAGTEVRAEGTVRADGRGHQGQVVLDGD